MSSVIDPPPPASDSQHAEDVPPKAGFAFGNRYEFGYQDRDHGWMIGILDGPELNQTEFYGLPESTRTATASVTACRRSSIRITRPNTDIGPGDGARKPASICGRSASAACRFCSRRRRVT